MSPETESTWTIRLGVQPNEWLDSVSEIRAEAVLELLFSWVPAGPPVDANLVETDDEDAFRYRTAQGNFVDFIAVAYERLIFVKQ